MTGIQLKFSCHVKLQIKVIYLNLKFYVNMFLAVFICIAYLYWKIKEKNQQNGRILDD